MNKNSPPPGNSDPRRSRLGLPLIAIGLLGLAACASAPIPPNQQLQAAELAITNAEKARVADYASPELGEARSKLTAAKSAVQSENMVLAARLAEESRAEAELAAARGEVVKARKVNEEMKQSIEILKQEMQRNTGGTR